MIIRKLFKFENAHIVRGCSSKRCRSSIHGHSYKVELFFKSNYLDNGQMVYDFGLLKQNIKELIDMFDHAITLWNEDEKAYLDAMKEHSDRYIVLPVSPSAEQFSRVIFLLVDKLFNLTTSINGEKEVALDSVIVHETETGYAQAFREDAYSTLMGKITLDTIEISETIVEDFSDKALFQKLKNGVAFQNPDTV